MRALPHYFCIAAHVFHSLHLGDSLLDSSNAQLCAFTFTKAIHLRDRSLEFWAKDGNFLDFSK